MAMPNSPERPPEDESEPSKDFLKQLARRGIRGPVPCLPNAPCNTDAVDLLVEDAYRKLNGETSPIPDSAFEALCLQVPPIVVSHHFGTIFYRGSRFEVKHPKRAATLMRKYHGEPELIELLEAGKIDFVQLHPDAPHDGEADKKGRTYFRGYLYRSSVYDLKRANDLPPSSEGTCTLPLGKKGEPPSNFVGRLRRDDDTTTHLLAWRLPNQKCFTRDAPSESEWSPPCLREIGSGRKGIMIALDPSLYDLTYRYYLELCTLLAERRRNLGIKL